MKNKLLKKGSMLFALAIFFAMTHSMNAQTGSTCGDPLVITSMPYSHSGTTSDYGDNYDTDDAPPLAPGAITNGSSSFSLYLTGDDVVYSYTAGANGTITINTTNDDDWIGLFAFTGCPFESTVGYHTSTSGASRSIPDLPVIAGETYYIVISTWTSPQSTDYTISITGTDVGDPPTCLKPTNLTLSSISTDEAEVTWTAGEDETEWEVLYGEAGFDIDTEGESVIVTDTAIFQVTDLDANTSYDVYVKAICEMDDESTFTGPLNFTTACIATDLPFTQNFEDVTVPAIPDCGYLEVNNGNAWETYTTTASGFDGQVLRYTYHTTSGNADSWYFTQGINLEADVNYQISYQYGGNSTNYTELLKVAYGSSAMSSNMTEELADHEININGSEVSEVAFTVDSDGVYYFGFQAHSASNEYYIYLDNIQVVVAPDCLKPSDLVLDGTSETTADISWITGDEETSWNISWGTPGYTPGDGDEISTATASTTTYQITGLTADTDYDVYVQADCGEGEESLWEGPLAVFTGYCIPTGSSNNADEIRNFTLSNLNNDSDNEEGTDGYSNYSNSVSPAELEAGMSYEASLTSGTGSGSHGAAIWIDYDQNGIFEASEMVSFISDITANETVNFPEFTVPDSTPDGTYRLRVQYHHNKDGDELDPCVTTSSFSETEDYGVTISEGDEGTYCIPALDCEDGDMITNVTFMEIDNNTTCSPDGYGDYTDMVATVESGGTYPISVSVGDGFPSESVSVWIDFDESGTFDEDEFFYIGTGSDEALTSDISIPVGLANGDYRMRVRVAAAGESLITWDLACDEEQGFGETEDYTVTVDGVLGMNDNVMSNFTYYPNPMEDVLHITADKNVESISVYNVLGQEVLGNKHFTDNKVDVSSLPTGTFIFRVTFENGNIKNFKAVKK